MTLSPRRGDDASPRRRGVVRSAPAPQRYRSRRHIPSAVRRLLLVRAAAGQGKAGLVVEVVVVVVVLLCGGGGAGWGWLG